MFCSQCGQQLSDGERRCGNCGLSIAKKSILHILGGVFFAVAAITAVGYFGYRHYKFAELKSRLEVAIGMDAGYTETILKIESDASNITYGEVFSLCDKSIEDRQKLIVERWPEKVNEVNANCNRITSPAFCHNIPNSVD